MIAFALLFWLALVTAAETTPVTVQVREGRTHGFLTLSSAAGETLAHGEVVQTVKDDRVDNRMTFRFKDGSVYDETVAYSQQKVFKLLSYRLVQRGPAFPASQDVAFDRASGTYRARLRDRPDGAEDVSEGKLDLPPDVYNGMTSTLLKNLPAGAKGSGHLVVFTPKPRLLRTDFLPQGQDQFFIGDTPRKAVRYLIKMEIGGLTGLVASAIGREPPDLTYWISAGPAPAFVKFEGPMYLKGPVWRIELATPRWPKAVSRR